MLETQGYQALTIEGIAQKAGVGKQTIYRWWSSKAAIVMEAYTQKASQRIPLPDTGSVCLDVQELLERLFTILTTSSAGKVVASLIAEAQLDSEFAQYRRCFKRYLNLKNTLIELALVALLYGINTKQSCSKSKQR